MRSSHVATTRSVMSRSLAMATKRMDRLRTGSDVIPRYYGHLLDHRAGVERGSGSQSQASFYTPRACPLAPLMTYGDLARFRCIQPRQCRDAVVSHTAAPAKLSVGWYSRFVQRSRAPCCRRSLSCDGASAALVPCNGRAKKSIGVVSQSRCEDSASKQGVFREALVPTAALRVTMTCPCVTNHVRTRVTSHHPDLAIRSLAALSCSLINSYVVRRRTAAHRAQENRKA